MSPNINELILFLSILPKRTKLLEEMTDFKLGTGKVSCCDKKRGSTQTNKEMLEEGKKGHES